MHVWRAELTSVAPDLGELLCEEEHARAERILNKEEGELWRRSRGLLRELLGRYLGGLEPASLRFVLGAHGKPALAQTGAAALNSLPFNMSHSGELALYAFSDAGAVGVDVEVARRPVNEVAIATRMLGADEAQRLQALDQPSRQREFLRAWTRHEAEVKCLGVGIGEAKAERTGGETWAVELELGPAAGAAVATERRPSELLCWDWPT